MISHSPVYVEPLDDYKLLLQFDNKEERIFEVKPYLEDSYFSSLKSEAIFKTVKTNQLTIESTMLFVFSCFNVIITYLFFQIEKFSSIIDRKHCNKKL